MISQIDPDPIKEETHFGEYYNGNLPYPERIKERLDIPALNGHPKYARMKRAIDSYYKSSEHLNTKSYQSIFYRSLVNLMI